MTLAEVSARSEKKCQFRGCPMPYAPNLPGHIHDGDNPHVNVEHDDHAGEYCDNNVSWCHPRKEAP